MVEIKLTMGGREYKKVRPLLIDWKNYMQHVEENKDKNLFTDTGAMDSAMEVVAQWFGNEFTKESLYSLELDTVYAVYRAIENNIAEVFTGAVAGPAAQEEQGA